MLKRIGRPSCSEDKQIEIISEMVVNSSQLKSHVDFVFDLSSKKIQILSL